MKIENSRMLFFVFFLVVLNSNAQIERLKTDIEHILKAKNAEVGVSIISNKIKDTLTINDNVHYPLQSVFKFPIALAVLSEIDNGKISLGQKIEITKKDLSANTWSPIKEKFPNGTVLTIKQILEYTVSQSDNIGCDILLKLIGGTDSVENFLKTNHIKNISIKANEAQMHQNWDTQYQNWSTPTAVNYLLTKAYYNNKNQMLSQKSHDLIWKIMKETTTGNKRIKGKLPKNTVVAHKTGTSGINNGITAATNDVGIIILPNDQLIFISIFVANSKETSETNEEIISEISKLAWDYYTR